MNGLGKRGADVAAQRIVAGHGLVGALQNDDVLLALERVNDGGLREGANDIDVDGADACAASLAQIIDRGLDIFSGRAERDEDRFGVVGLVFADEAVTAAGEFGELLVGVFKESENRLGEVVAPRHHALHVVFLVLHRAEQNGIGEVHHLGDAAAGGAEENALRLGGAVDDVVGRAQVFADQLRLVLVKGALQVRGEEAVHDVHAGREAQLGDAAQDERLVGGLLRVLAEEHDPAGIERAINIVVAAVHVEGVLGEGACAHFQHHGGTLAGRVIVLLHAVDHALAGGEVDHALAADGVGDGAALGRVLAFGLDGDGVVAEDVQVPFGIGLLEEFAALGGRRDGIKDAGVGDARLRVVGDQLISVCGNTNARIASRSFHDSLSLSPVLAPM